MSYQVDSYGNAYFPAGVSVASIPATTGTQAKVLVPGVNGRISSATVAQLITQSGGNLVSSVFGRTGVVTAQQGDYNTDQVTEGQAQYFSTSRARKSIFLTTFNTSGPATYDSGTGILNIPQYVSDSGSGTGGSYVPLTRTITINGQTADLSVDRAFSIDTIPYPSIGIPLSNGTSWGASITDNSANWNTAYGWGNHAGLYSLLGHTHTIANITGLQTALDGKEPTIAAGTTAQYWRGDKSWQTLPSYSLPIASASVLGGIKVGTNLSIDANGVLSANDTSVAWSELTSVPTSFTPSAHTHPISDITTISISSVANGQLLKYNSTTTKWENWTPTYISSYTDTNTTYSLGIPTSTTKLRLTGSDSSTSDITFTAGLNVTITRTSASEFTIASSYTDTNTWNANTKTADGYVTAPGAVANKVWKTDASGNPAWRDDADTIVTTLAWTSITGRPSALSSFTNDLGNYGSWITSSGTAAAINQTVAVDTAANLVYSQIANSDFFRIRVGGSDNNGWAEIATADDGTEPIYVRQYTGVFTTVTRTATLLDASGNTTFPGALTASSFSGTSYWTNVSGRPTSLSQLTNDLGNYGGWVVRSGDSMSGRLTIDSRSSTNLPLHILSTEPYMQIEAVGATNSTGIRMYSSGGYGAYIGNYATGELVLVAANTEVAYLNSNSIRVNKYRFNGNGSLSGNGTAEIIDMANVGMSMQSLNYRWYNNLANVLYMTLDYNGNLTANAFFESSDIRYKDVIETNPNLTLDGLDVIKFTRKGNKVIRYGYSAQQVKSLSEDLVGGTKDELTVNYSDVHTLKIAALEKRIAELEAKLK